VVTVASPSYRTNVRLLQKSFSALKRKASPINISFSVPKTELIHWRTARSKEPPCSLPVQLEDQLFYPQSHLKWLGFIFTPAFDPGPTSPGGIHLQMPPSPRSAASPPPGWASHPTFVSPWRVHSLLQFFHMDPLSRTPPSHPEPDVSFLATGLLVDHQLLCHHQHNMFA